MFRKWFQSAMMASVATLGAASSPAAADWMVISDFTGLSTNTTSNGHFLDEQGDWRVLNSATGAFVNSNFYKVLDDGTSLPDGGTHMSVSPRAAATDRAARHALPVGGIVDEGETGTLFFRFRARPGNQKTEIHLGLSDGSTPYHRDHINAMVTLGVKRTQDGNDTNLFYGTSGPDAPNVISSAERATWYNVWFVVDNASDTVSLYMNTGDQNATGADQVFGGLGFATPTSGGLQSLLLSVNNNLVQPSPLGGWNDDNNNSFRFDDLSIAAGSDLTNPYAIPEPASGMLLGMGALGLCFLRNRRS